jgi:hypothetical protein
VYVINTGIFMGLSVWILGFALMVAGWLVDVVFEGYGTIPAKILYKTGAIIVAIPVMYLLWKSSRWLFVNRIDIVLLLRSAIGAVQGLLDEFFAITTL